MDDAASATKESTEFERRLDAVRERERSARSHLAAADWQRAGFDVGWCSSEINNLETDLRALLGAATPDVGATLEHLVATVVAYRQDISQLFAEVRSGPYAYLLDSLKRQKLAREEIALRARGMSGRAQEAMAKALADAARGAEIIWNASLEMCEATLRDDESGAVATLDGRRTIDMLKTLRRDDH